MIEKETIRNLSTLGISKNAAACYIDLVQLGPSFISEIVEKSNLHRPTVYKAVAELVERGLVTKIPKGKRSMYHPEAPDKLQLLMQDFNDGLQKSIGELSEIHRLRSNETFVYFYQGKKSLTTVYRDLVTSQKHGDTYYRISSTDSEKIESAYLPADYREIRDKKQLQRFVITNEPHAQEMIKYLNRNVKILPEKDGKFNHNVTEIIYGDKVVFIDFNSETSLVIEDKEIANFQKHLMKSLYQRL